MLSFQGSRSKRQYTCLCSLAAIRRFCPFLLPRGTTARRLVRIFGCRQSTTTLFGQPRLICPKTCIRTGHPRTPAAPAFGLAANGAKASVTLRDITQSIDDVVQSERRKRCGDTISEDETRDLVVRALIKSFRAYRQEHVLTDPSSPSPDELKIVAAMRDMNESLSKPAIVASTPGSEARRVLVAAAVDKGVSFTGLENSIGPVQREFFAECLERRKREMSTTSAAKL